jgi:hypothetical protein
LRWVVNATPRPLDPPPPRKDPVPILQEAGWVSGPVWTGADNLAHTGIRFSDPPARSESLYRLSYRGPLLTSYVDSSLFILLLDAAASTSQAT